MLSWAAAATGEVTWERHLFSLGLSFLICKVRLFGWANHLTQRSFITWKTGVWFDSMDYYYVCVEITEPWSDKEFLEYLASTN